MLNLFSKKVAQSVFCASQMSHRFVRQTPGSVWMEGLKSYEKLPASHKKQAYLDPRPVNIKFNQKIYQGGLLPRLKDSPPVQKTVFKPVNQWTEKRALFGQNDYIDILGDGSIHPKDFYRGPLWARGLKAEAQQSIRHNKLEGDYLKEFEPSKYHILQKNIKFNLKMANKRRNNKFLKFRDKP